MATEIREGDLVTYSIPHISKIRENRVARGWPAESHVNEQAVGIVEQITETTPRAMRRARMMGRSPQSTTAYRITFQIEGGPDLTVSLRRHQIKPAR